jgi:preprotein translocase subunit SecD
MEIIEERTIGPSLGAENIKKGFHSTMWGFAAIAVFMIAYYRCSACLGRSRWRQPAVPGRPAVAAAGHADAARHRRHRADAGHGDRRQRADQRTHPRGTAQRRTPQAAIHTGYDRAFDTILDSNITTLIAGIALLIFGSGPVRGFAVVHCLGILTSMFSPCRLARDDQPDLRPPPQARIAVDRPGLETRQQHACGNQIRTYTRWNSSASRKTSRSCAMRWCSTSSR